MALTGCGARDMAIQIEILIIAAIGAIAIIAVGRAIMRGLAISRRPSHHLATQTGTTPPPPEVNVPRRGGL